MGCFWALLIGVVACTSTRHTAAGHRHGRPPAGSTTTATERANAPSTTSVAVVPGVPGAVVTNGSRDRRAVALTFDSNMTDRMLAELDQGRVASFDNRAVIEKLDSLRVPATFFLSGKWMERYADETRRLASDPLFELGTHSYAHRAFHLPCYRLSALPVTEMLADVQHVEQLLATFTDHPTPYFRFPGGCYDQTALEAIAPARVTVVQYDVVSGDAFGTSITAIVDHVLADTRNGSIVVMHVTGGNTAPLTAEALPPIVAGLRARGFDLVKISQLLVGGA